MHILMMKIWWYDFAEDRRLGEDDIKNAKDKYFKMVDDNIEDSSDLDKFLVVLNKENRDHFITNKLGCRTIKNLSKKTFWLCLFHPRYRKMTAEEIEAKKAAVRSLNISPNSVEINTDCDIKQSLSLVMAEIWKCL